MKRSLLLTFIGCLLASPLFADVSGTSTHPSPRIITDDDAAGVTSTVTITDSEIIQSAKFSINGLTHSWIGDLIITVENETTGSKATLMSRPGFEGVPPGFSADVNGTYMFEDGGASIWTASNTNDSDFEVPEGTYAASDAGEAAVSLQTAFAGENTMANWKFTVTDTNATQIGQFISTSVNFTSVAVPEPGTMATVVFSTFLAGVYFRRRHLKTKAEEATA